MSVSEEVTIVDERSRGREVGGVMGVIGVRERKGRMIGFVSSSQQTVFCRWPAWTGCGSVEGGGCEGIEGSSSSWGGGCGGREGSSSSLLLSSSGSDSADEWRAAWLRLRLKERGEG